ncbi:hypothetical protein EPA93_44240 [Ktedonosporobacter rubrisoli]|uniref:Uncharacterized protein n=1 Tax=Ktedonosporobacter rubrisoli TaxID=2509675 RepID=A0A4P6K2Z5_KTERU|nr:hypothetical protein [Ktedonosporobacter rubrisoli]QBD82607.1 hypothetical protein EPA93_44240 [Ktedonosporobacter rubrisoli]
MDLLVGPLYWHFSIYRAGFSSDSIKLLTDVTLAVLKDKALVLHNPDERQKLAVVVSMGIA